MQEFESLSHVRWECKYHVVFIPKYRRKVIYGNLRRAIGRILRSLCEQKGVEVLEGTAMPDHIHMCLKIPPKFAVSYIVGFIKGKSAIHIARAYAGRKRNYVGQHFWARGYFASTVGRDEQVIREYIRHQEAEDRRIDQLNLM